LYGLWKPTKYGKLDTKRISIGVILSKIETEDEVVSKLFKRMNESFKFSVREQNFIKTIAEMKDPFDSYKEITVLEMIALDIAGVYHSDMKESLSLVSDKKFDLFCPAFNLVRDSLRK
jgi:hypothetical protein